MLVYALGLLFGIAVACAALAMLVGVHSVREARTAEQDRLHLIGAAFTLEDLDLSRPFSERIFQPIATKVLAFLARLTPQRNVQELQHKLEVSGRPHNWTVVDLTGVRVLCGLLLAGLVLPLTFMGDIPLPRKIILVAAIGALGYYLPLLWLNGRINKRKRALLRALPDGLDMLNICVGAGLGFDAALSRVGQVWQTPLADEFNRVMAEIRLGTTRRDALTAFASRAEVPEVENFVATIIQADQLGVSIAKVLRTQADQMRLLRRQRAEEQARQASIKLLFPLVFLIFPAMLAVLLGPAVPQIVNTLSMF